MSLLQRKAINADIYRVYTAGDQYHLANRVPEVGSEAVYQDGRKYTFCSFAAAATAGSTVGQAAGSAGVAVGSNLSGVTEVNVTLAGLVVPNGFAGGMLLEQTSGILYPVKSNTVSGVADLVVFELEHPLQSDITAAAGITLTVKEDANVVVGTATNDIVGFAIADQAIGDYAWVQTAGIGAMTDNGGAVGDAVMGGASGATSTQTAGNKQIATIVATGSGYDVINICL